MTATQILATRARRGCRAWVVSSCLFAGSAVAFAVSLYVLGPWNTVPLTSLVPDDEHAITQRIHLVTGGEFRLDITAPWRPTGAGAGATRLSQACVVLGLQRTGALPDMVRLDSFRSAAVSEGLGLKYFASNRTLLLERGAYTVTLQACEPHGKGQLFVQLVRTGNPKSQYVGAVLLRGLAWLLLVFGAGAAAMTLLGAGATRPEVPLDA